MGIVGVLHGNSYVYYPECTPIILPHPSSLHSPVVMVHFPTGRTFGVVSRYQFAVHLLPASFALECHVSESSRLGLIYTQGSRLKLNQGQILRLFIKTFIGFNFCFYTCATFASTVLSMLLCSPFSP